LWSWPYTAFFLEAILLFFGKGKVVMFIDLLPFLEREGIVVMAIHSLLLRSYPLVFGKGKVVMFIDLLPFLDREGIVVNYDPVPTSE